MKLIGNYLKVSSKENRIILSNKNTPLFPIRFENRMLAIKVARIINDIYGTDLDYLGHVEWLSGIQQIHQDKLERYMFGDLINSLINLNRVVTKEDVEECAKQIQKKYLTN